MKREESCGAVVFTRVGGELRYVLVRSLEGVYGFPKGHREPGETPEQTALREIREEVGLRVTLLPGFRTQDEYDLPKKPDTWKHVDFFLAEYAEQPITPQKEELRDAGLYPLNEALRLIPHESWRRVLREAHAFLLSTDTILQ